MRFYIRSTTIDVVVWYPEHKLVVGMVYTPRLELLQVSDAWCLPSFMTTPFQFGVSSLDPTTLLIYAAHASNFLTRALD